MRRKKRKIISRKRRYLLVSLLAVGLIAWGSISIYRVGVTTSGEIIKLVDHLIVEEQKRDLVRFEDKLVIANGHFDQLQEELKSIKTGSWVKLPENKKRDLLKIVWELRKDSWRIESALLNHQNDISITFYPRKDEEIENKFKEYWPVHILIDRVVEDTERIIYSPRGVDKFQLQKLLEDLQNAKRILGNTKS